MDFSGATSARYVGGLVGALTSPAGISDYDHAHHNVIVTDIQGCSWPSGGLTASNTGYLLRQNKVTVTANCVNGNFGGLQGVDGWTGVTSSAQNNYVNANLQNDSGRVGGLSAQLSYNYWAIGNVVNAWISNGNDSSAAGIGYTLNPGLTVTIDSFVWNSDSSGAMATDNPCAGGASACTVTNSSGGADFDLTDETVYQALGGDFSDPTIWDVPNNAVPGLVGIGPQ